MLGGDQSGLGHGGLVPSYGGLASLGSLHQNGVTNNNSTLAYLTSTGQISPQFGAFPSKPNVLRNQFYAADAPIYPLI